MTVGMIAFAFVILSATAAGWAATKRVPASVKVSAPFSVTAGSKVTVTVRLRPTKRTLRNATVSLHLSRNSKRDADDKRLIAHNVKTLKARKTSTVKLRATIWSRTQARRYQLLACLTLKKMTRCVARSLRVRMRPTLPPPVPPPPVPPPPAPPPPPPPPPLPPPPPPPLELEGSPITIAPGSVEAIEVPSPMRSIASLKTSAPDPDFGVAERYGVYDLVASSVAAPKGVSIELSGVGCTSTDCNVSFRLRLPVTVRTLAAPPGDPDGFTSPSPDRLAAGAPIDIGGVRLGDQLDITLGTPDAVGTRAAADAIASQVGGVISGGLEVLGVYEIRWTAPQDLEAKIRDLEALDGVTSVSPALHGIVGTEATPPGDWDDDTDEVIWPFTQIRAQQAWDTSTGSDVTVGIVDSGRAYADHEDLDTVEKLGSAAEELHATHVAGLACASANGLGLVGAAWGCSIVSTGLRDSSPTAVLEAATRAAQSGARVVNMSLGYYLGKFCHTAAQMTKVRTTYYTDKDKKRSSANSSRVRRRRHRLDDTRLATSVAPAFCVHPGRQTADLSEHPHHSSRNNEGAEVRDLFQLRSRSRGRRSGWRRCGEAGPVEHRVPRLRSVRRVQVQHLLPRRWHVDGRAGRGRRGRPRELGAQRLYRRHDRRVHHADRRRERRLGEGPSAATPATYVPQITFLRERGPPAHRERGAGHASAPTSTRDNAGSCDGGWNGAGWSPRSVGGVARCPRRCQSASDGVPEWVLGARRPQAHQWPDIVRLWPVERQDRGIEQLPELQLGRAPEDAHGAHRVR